MCRRHTLGNNVDHMKGAYLPSQCPALVISTHVASMKLRLDISRPQGGRAHTSLDPVCGLVSLKLGYTTRISEVVLLLKGLPPNFRKIKLFP